MKIKWQSVKVNILPLQGSTVGKYFKLYGRKYRPSSHRTENKYKEQNELRETNWWM